VETGTGPVPPATVQIDPAATQTASDGSFSFDAPQGATSLLAVYQKTPSDTPISFRFDIPALNGTTDLGDLYIGPEKVLVQGRVLSAADSSPIAGAVISFAGRKTSSGADGRFSLQDVAYSSANNTGFLGIQGRVTATGFFAKNFAPTQGASGGVVTLDDIQLTPETGGTPPPPPYNIFGTVSPSAFAPGTVVKLFLGGNEVREYTVGSDGKYGFFVVAGTYVIKFNNPTNGKSAPDQNVTLNAANEVVQRDVTLQ
jgi:hypothetical protein